MKQEPDPRMLGDEPDVMDKGIRRPLMAKMGLFGAPTS